MARKIIERDTVAIKKLLNSILGTSGYTDVVRLGGLTNHTYRVTVQGGAEYLFRIPGEGTEELINRGEEKISTELACKLEIDADLIYFGEDGTKISAYIKSAVTMSPESMRQESSIKEAARIFKKLHNCGIDTGVMFDVFDMAASYEKFIMENNVELYNDYKEIKAAVTYIKSNLDEEYTAPMVPCHNDPLCENWIDSHGRLFLVDWEYSGMNDGMWDLADISIEADYGKDEDELLLKEYLGRNATVLDKRCFSANKIYLDYLWTLWGKTRVPFDGEPMEEYALERYIRLKRNINELAAIEEG